MKSRGRQKLLMIGLCAVALGVVAEPPVRELWREAPPAQSTVRVREQPPAPRPEEIARPHLKWAEEESAKVLDHHLDGLLRFFAESKKHTPQFAREALDWESKYNLVFDAVPFSKGGRHQQYIRSRFEHHIFAPAAVEQAVQQVVSGYLRELRSIEGKMLVRVRADLSDFPSEYPIGTLDEQRLGKAYQQAITTAISAAKSDAAAGASLEVVSIIVGEVLTQAAVELGVSAGILGAGAALSWETFGIGLVVGIIVDVAVSWVWDWYADPKGELTARINSRLDDIQRLIMEGSPQTQGLRGRLQELARERAQLRETAILNLLTTR